MSDQIKTIQQFIEAHKGIKGDDEYSSLGIVVTSDYQVIFTVWSSKLEQSFNAPTPEGVLESYDNALKQIKTDFSIVEPNDSETLFSENDSLA